MDTNNPETGTGYSVAEAATHIESLMDSDNGTIPEVDAENEADEASTIDAEATEGETETTGETASDETTEEVAEGDDAQDKEEPTAGALDDATLVDVQGDKHTLRELKDGYLRRAAFTQKTQELKQHLKTYQVQQKELGQIREENLKAVELMALQLSQAVELVDAPNDQLLKDDPHEYLIQRQKFERQQNAINHLRDQHAGLLREKAKAEAEQMVLRQVAARDQLNEWHPEFADAKTGDGLLIEVGKFMIEELGYSAEEINHIDDPRHFRAMYRLFQAEQRAKHVAKAVSHIEKKPPLVAPGTSTKTHAKSNDAFQRDVQKAKRTGSLHDAASALSKLF